MSPKGQAAAKCDLMGTGTENREPRFPRLFSVSRTLFPSLWPEAFLLKHGDGFESEKKKKVAELSSRLASFHSYLKNADLSDLPGRGKRASINAYRFFILLYEKFLETDLPRNAAALTYTSILTVFPLLAIISFAFSIVYTPEREQESLLWIQEQFLPTVDNDQPLTAAESELVERHAAEFTLQAQELFSDVIAKFRESKAGIGAFGFIGLLIACGVLYYTIEVTVNRVWQATHRGTWIRVFTNFVTVLALAPVIIGLSITTTGIALALLDEDPNAKPEFAVPRPEETKAAEEGESVVKEPSWLDTAIPKLRTFTTAFGFAMPLIPVVMNALLLAVAFSFIPRTRVSFAYALLGGLTASLLWETAKYLFFYYVYATFVNQTLADALGIGFIFLLWLYITWIILLVGNLVVYTSQNFAELWSEKMIVDQTLFDARLIVAIMVILARRFHTQGGGMTEYELRTRLGVPQHAFIELIGKLQRRGFVSPEASDAYQLARPAEQIYVRELLAAGCDMSMLPIARRGSASIREVFEWFQRRSEDVAGEAALSDMLSSETDFFVEQSAPAAAGK